MEKYKSWLIERFLIERKRFDRSGVCMWTFIQDQILGMKWLSTLIGNLLTAFGFALWCYEYACYCCE